jgi:hypothetical protein
MIWSACYSWERHTGKLTLPNPLLDSPTMGGKHYSRCHAILPFSQLFPISRYIAYLLIVIILAIAPTFITGTCLLSVAIINITSTTNTTTYLLVVISPHRAPVMQPDIPKPAPTAPVIILPCNPCLHQASSCLLSIAWSPMLHQARSLLLSLASDLASNILHHYLLSQLARIYLIGIDRSLSWAFRAQFQDVPAKQQSAKCSQDLLYLIIPEAISQTTPSQEPSKSLASQQHSAITASIDNTNTYQPL